MDSVKRESYEPYEQVSTSVVTRYDIAAQMLIIFSGLPGVGKTQIAAELARQIGAVYLRIDSIEQALRDWGLGRSLDDSGYRIAYAIAIDNLRLGRIVIADCVNPLAITRQAWVEVARQAGVRGIEVEILCSDVDEHRRRVEARTEDIPSLSLASWQDVIGRQYARVDPRSPDHRFGGNYRRRERAAHSGKACRRGHLEP